MRMAGRIPLVLLACGSFNPITNQHMRLFELARDHMHHTGRFRVVAGIVSPVSDRYGKQGLVSARHRVAMAKLALSTSDWVKVDDWECEQPDWTETIVTMSLRCEDSGGIQCSSMPVDQHHHSRLLDRTSQWAEPVGTDLHRGAPRVMLLCGADLLDTFKEWGLWRPEHIEELVAHFGLVCVSRRDLRPERAIHESDTLYRHRHNVFLVQEWVRNDSSSTEVRRALRRGVSVKYLLPDTVIEYIQQHRLYTSEGANESTAL